MTFFFVKLHVKFSLQLCNMNITSYKCFLFFFSKKKMLHTRIQLLKQQELKSMAKLLQIIVLKITTYAIIINIYRCILCNKTLIYDYDLHTSSLCFCICNFSSSASFAFLFASSASFLQASHA